jgi:hypothetical protein
MPKQPEPAPTPTSEGQPVVSTLRIRQVDPQETEQVLMRVTAKGHGQISTGGEYGFERYAMFAEFICPASSARALYNRGWAEPVGSVEEVRKLTLQWLQTDKKEEAANIRSLKARDDILANGAPTGGTVGWAG